VSTPKLGTWLGRLRATATFVYIAALCLAVAELVIAFVPKSPVRLALPTTMLTGLDRVGGVVSGVAVDHGSTVLFKVTDPSLGQRLAALAIGLPSLLLVAEIARRMGKLLLSAQRTDPFTAQTARDLTAVAKITAAGGIAVSVVAALSGWALSDTMLTNGSQLTMSSSSVLGWLAVGLIFAGFAQLISRGVDMRAELDTVI
jgi:hypothetical protein